MNLKYHNQLEESTMTLTDFSCADGRSLLEQKGLYKILWTMKDVANLYIDGCLTELKKNQVLFCTPLNTIGLPRLEDSMISLVFNREFYCIQDNDQEVSCNGLLFYGSSNSVVINLESKDVYIFHTLYNSLKDEFINDDHLQGVMLRSLLVRLLITSNRLVHEEFSDPVLSHSEIDLIRKFNLLVEKHFSSHHSVTEYAIMMDKSPKTLANVFLKHNNKSPLKFINERILVEAKRLLLFSDKPVKEISKLLGYTYKSHFSKFFKSHQGISPSQFRKKLVT